MNMFCYQCQETVGNSGCTWIGVCGKKAETANLLDLLVYTLKGISLLTEKENHTRVGRFLVRALFATITNANFDDQRIIELIREGLELKGELKKNREQIPNNLQNTAPNFTV